jgi:hypothetical protein
MDNEKRRNTIIAIIIVVVLVVGLFAFWIISSLNGRGQTGGEGADKTAAVITTDVSGITKHGFPEKLYKDFSQNFFDAMSVINPTCNKPASAKNITDGDNDMTFDIVWCNETYNVELTNDGKNYNFTVSKNNEMLVTYDSSKKGKAYVSPAQISKFLPMTVKAEGGADVTIKLKNPNNATELEVGIDNCGSQEKKNKAVTAAKAALELSGFNPEDFTYITPDFCDAKS